MIKLSLFLIIQQIVLTSVSVSRFSKRIEESILTKDIEPIDKNLYKKYQNFHNFYIKVLEKEIHLSRSNNFLKIPQNKNLLKKIKYDKFIPEDLKGLHREIKYEISYEIEKKNFDMKKLENGSCFISILDYCDFNFYIDFEEIDMNENFVYYENERMNIEKINEDSPQYFYILQLRVLKNNYKIQKNSIIFNFTKNIKYHLRYGKSHQYGFSEHKLGRNFDLIINCIKNENNLEFFQRSLKNFWAMANMDYREKDIFFYMFDNYDKPITHIIPVIGVDNGFIKFSTLFFVMLGLVLLGKDIFVVN